MTLGERWRAWRRRRKRSKAARLGSDTPLREFVYLDEVSVYSLLASRLGAVASEFTEAESSSLTAGLQGSIGANGGVLRSTVGSKLESKSDQSSQVVKKSIIQSTFKELYDLEKDRFLLYPADPPVRPASGRNEDRDSIKPGMGASGEVPHTDLTRGLLLEIEVELEPNDIFKVHSTLELMMDLVRDQPELAGSAGAAGMGDANVAVEALRRLLAGLVPLDARVMSHRVIVHDGSEYVVPNTAGVGGLPDARQSRELRISAVAEIDLFWRDVRRVLFAGSRYTMLCRVSRDGLQSETNPLKLLDVMRAVAPRAAEEFTLTLQSAVDEMKQFGDESTPAAVFEAQVADYGRLLAARMNVPFPADPYGEWLTGLGLAGGDPPIDRQVEILREATDVLVELTATDVDREVARELRRTARGAAEAPRLAPASDHVAGAPTVRANVSRFLEVEVVAIYW